MTIYIRIENGAPVGDLLDGDNLRQCGIEIDEGYAPVTLTECPTVQPGFIVAGSHFEYANGVVVQRWDVRERTEQEVAALLQHESAYQRLRAAEYPPMTDYLDGIVKGDQAQVQAYIDACLAVKAKYPKPSEGQ